MAGTKKVGGANAATSNATDAAKKEPKKGKSVYNVKDAKDAQGKSIVTDKGHLTGVPADFDPKKHKPLGKKVFGDNESAFLRYRAMVMQGRIDKMVELKTGLLTKADTIEKYGSSEKRKTAAKLERVKKQMAALEAELASEGVEDTTK